jgi:hypothetical protein
LLPAKIENDKQKDVKFNPEKNGHTPIPLSSCLPAGGADVFISPSHPLTFRYSGACPAEDRLRDLVKYKQF